MSCLQVIKYTKGGSHAVACFATSPKAFKMAVDITRRKGTVVAVGLPAGTHNYLFTSLLWCELPTLRPNIFT